MRSAALILVALGIIMTAMVGDAVAQVSISSSSSANSGIYFGNQSDSNNNAVLAAIITGMFALAGTVLNAIVKYGPRGRSRASRKRNRIKAESPQENLEEPLAR